MENKITAELATLERERGSTVKGRRNDKEGGRNISVRILTFCTIDVCSPGP